MAELIAERCEGLGPAGGGERVEPDEQLAGAGDDVAGAGEGFADQGVCLVAGAGVVAVQRPGQRGFGVVGGHPDGVGDLLDLGLQADHVRGDLVEADAGGNGRCGVLGGLESGPGGFDRGVQRVDHLVGDGDRLAGRWVAQRCQAGVALGLGCGGEDLGVADLAGSGFLRRVGDQPGGVVGRGGVGVQGVQGEVGAGVAEVVLLPPPRGPRMTFGSLVTIRRIVTPFFAARFPQMGKWVWASVGSRILSVVWHHKVVKN